MDLYVIDEPKLQFAEDQHVCPRAGIARHGVYDATMPQRRDSIQVGAVGTSHSLEVLAQWLERCEKGIEAPKKRQPLLFPPFPGFSKETGFRRELVFGEGLTRALPTAEIGRIARLPDHRARVDQLVELYLGKIEYLAEYRPVDVIVCVLPDDLRELILDSESRVDDEEDDAAEDDVPEREGATDEVNFRRALKARAMHLRKPLQLVWTENLTERPSGRQDDATRAWNLMTALYYKAGVSIPWRLVEQPDRPRTCHVGLGFYRSRNQETLRTSMAQIFDEMGRSVILRGMPIEESKDKQDRRPYLSGEQAHHLLSRALREYRQALGHLPARLVLHKTSRYRDDELEGLRQATHDSGIHLVDFVNVQPSSIRLFRNGLYPPYRGTCVALERDRHLLYTRGSVLYYRTYPGMYVPQPLEVRLAAGDTSLRQLCEEVLALTKMNWNNTRFDGKIPITLRCARKVGEVMKYLGEGDRPDISYRYYM